MHNLSWDNRPAEIMIEIDEVGKDSEGYNSEHFVEISWWKKIFTVNTYSVNSLENISLCSLVIRNYVVIWAFNCMYLLICTYKKT